MCSEKRREGREGKWREKGGRKKERRGEGGGRERSTHGLSLVEVGCGAGADAVGAHPQPEWLVLLVLDAEVVDGVHGQRLDDLQVAQDGLAARAAQHLVVRHHLALAGEGGKEIG